MNAEETNGIRLRPYLYKLHNLLPEISFEFGNGQDQEIEEAKAH